MTCRRVAPFLPVFLVFAFLTAPVYAAEAGQDNAYTSPLGWLFRWLHFLILVGGGVYLVARKAPAYFRSRAERVMATIAESAQIREDGERRLREAEANLKWLDEELANLRTAARRQAAAEAERIRAATREEMQKIERAAQAEVEAAERAARMELKAAAARLAVERAEALIRQQLTPQAEAAMLRSFLESLGRSAS